MGDVLRFFRGVVAILLSAFDLCTRKVLLEQLAQFVIVVPVSMLSYLMQRVELDDQIRPGLVESEPSIGNW